MTKLSPGELDALGFDPTPGDPDAFAVTAGTVRGAANVFGEVSRVLHGSEGDSDWRGQAALAFRALLAEEFRPLVDVAAQSLADTARPLDGWVAYLRTAQAATRRLATDAVFAVEDLQRAQASLTALPAPPLPGAPLPTDPDALRAYDEAELTYCRAGNAITLAQENLQAIRGQATRHGHDYDTEQASVARAVKHAAAAAPNEPGLWDRLNDAAGGLLGGLGDTLSKLNDTFIGQLEKIAPVTQFIGDIAGALGSVCTVLAFVPGLQFLGPIAIGLGIVALGAHYLSAAGTTGSFARALTTKDVMLDAVGVVAGRGAAKVGKAVLASAKASGAPTRSVRQLIGPAKELPMGYFQLARSAYPMGATEFAYRTVQFHANAAGSVATVIGTPDMAGDLQRWATGQFHPRPPEPDAAPSTPEPDPPANLEGTP